MKKTIAFSIAAVAAVTAGVTALAWNDQNATDAATYASTHPAVTITQTAPPEPAPTVTVTVETSSVPQSCLDALDNAETGFGYAADAITAAGEFDVAGLNEATRKTKELAPTWSANKAACRAAGNL